MLLSACAMESDHDKLQHRNLIQAWGALIFGIVALFASRSAEPAAAYEVRAPGITVRFSEDGTLTGIVLADGRIERPVKGGTFLSGCVTRGKVAARSLANGGVEFSRTWVETPGANSSRIVERFIPTQSSVRWEVEIRGEGAPWTTPIETRLLYPAAATKSLIWAPWSDPRMGNTSAAPPRASATPTSPADLLVPNQGAAALRKRVSAYDTGEDWADPLLPRPFADTLLHYGAPAFRPDKPRLAFAPFAGNLLAIPMASILESERDVGLSIILSPEDLSLDMTLSLTAEGGVVFRRLFHRLSDKSTVHFAADLVAHEADWRGGLRWISTRYPEYFDPPNPAADDMAGTGAYASLETKFDVAKMRRMAFRVNWLASFDFPYMGMFLPPVTDDHETWTRYGGGTTSVAIMEDYARRMRALGFFVLSYFNVTEFGAHVPWPLPRTTTTDDAHLWKDGNAFLDRRLAGAILHVPSAIKPEVRAAYGKYTPGGPYYTWEDGVAMDCGDPAYKAFLLEQARRHLDRLPDAAGFAIDRMDWLRLYNPERDDGLSWFDGRPAASLLISWRKFMEAFGPMVHQAGKVIFVNNHDKRLDLLRHVDGIFDEHTYGGGPLNLTALLTLRKAALGWTSEEADLRPDPDAFFQRYLYLGVFPMAPFPSNDHSIRPSAWTDRQYLDYGPLLDTLRGKKWVLRPHVVQAVSGAAKVNLFEVPGGYALPVTFAGAAAAVDIEVRGLDGFLDGASAVAVHPGQTQSMAVTIRREGGAVRLHVPLRRGCAMVRITRPR